MILLIVSPGVNRSRTNKSKKSKWLKVYRKQVKKKKKKKVVRNPVFLPRAEFTEEELPTGLGYYLCNNRSEIKNAGPQDKESMNPQLNQEMYFSDE